MMVKDYPINSIEVARLRDENYTLEQQNADLVAALDELFKSQKALMQNNNLDNLAENMLRVTNAVVEAEHALIRAGK